MLLGVVGERMEVGERLGERLGVSRVVGDKGGTSGSGLRYLALRRVWFQTYGVIVEAEDGGRVGCVTDERSSQLDIPASMMCKIGSAGSSLEVIDCRFFGRRNVFVRMSAETEDR